MDFMYLAQSRCMDYSHIKVMLHYSVQKTSYIVVIQF